MKYKAFEDWYREATIKHLIIQEYKNDLISPPFATELCKNYSTFKNISQSKSIELELPPCTSKTNTCEIINDSAWMIPYGIYDEMNQVVQIKDTEAIYHNIGLTGKGQFYSLATNGETGFSFPLGYEGTNSAIYIKNDTIELHKLPVNGKKLHMGTVYCNGKFWSMPRGDDPGYNLLLGFDGLKIYSFEITEIDNNITRKYSDIIIKENTLYALPFGETPGLNEIIEFDTDSNSMNVYKINGRDFGKKYNTGVLLNKKIIAVPYGEDYSNDSNWGLVFDTETKETKQFDIGISFGGKYRFRSGIAFKNHAYFFPTGTPSCPILKINDEGEIEKKLYMTNFLLGRPIIHKGSLTVMAYNIDSRKNYVFLFDEHLNLFSEIDIA